MSYMPLGIFVIFVEMLTISLVPQMTSPIYGHKKSLEAARSPMRKELSSRETMVWILKPVPEERFLFDVAKLSRSHKGVVFSPIQ